MPSFVHDVHHILSDSDRIERKKKLLLLLLHGNKKLKFNLMVDPQNADLLYLVELEKRLHLIITCRCT